jgi:hypothetical protein
MGLSVPGIEAIVNRMVEYSEGPIKGESEGWHERGVFDLT